jgi:threonine/homoserine/homoserine lactone efflux protein
MALSGLLVFALALIVAAGSPGPSIAALVARVMTSGLRDVLPFLAAMWLGEAIWLGCAVAGLAMRVNVKCGVCKERPD